MAENNSGIKERVKLNTAKYLFNRAVIAYPKVSKPEIAKVAGAKDRQVYRWIDAMDLGAKPKGPEKSHEEIGDWLGSHLTFDQLMDLYNWAREKRFDKEMIKNPNPKTRAYNLTKKRKSTKPKISEEEQQAKVAAAQKAVANLGMADDAVKNLQAKVATKPMTLAEKLNNWIVDGSWSQDQAINLAKLILSSTKKSPINPAKVNDDMSMSIYGQMKQDTTFNRFEWAFSTLVKSQTAPIIMGLKRLLNHEPVNLLDDQEITVRGIYQMYQNHQGQIDVTKVLEDRKSED